MLLPVRDSVDVWELLREPEAFELIDQRRDWYRGLGDVHDEDSRRLDYECKSPALLILCSAWLSSPSGDDARRFWPAATPGEKGSGCPLHSVI